MNLFSEVRPARPGLRLKFLLSLFVFFSIMFSACSGTAVQSEPGSVFLAEIDGIINPPVAEYLARVLQQAEQQDAALVVIEMDTPGGLDTSMRQMFQAMLASPVPVAVYVAPSGARAASAGLFILQAADIAAMAPGTNTGAAHPVGLGGETDETQEAKAVNDAAATIRALANERGRNAEWAEQAVRESVSITAQEALELDVIDLVASDLQGLLEAIDGQPVETPAGEVRLAVAQAPVVEVPMNFAESLLHAITDPNIAFILLSVGSLALLAELYNPGALVPGVTGAIALILAFFSLGNLPTNWAGVALVGLAILLFVGELLTEGTGFLGVGALVAFLLGGLILFRPLRPASPALPDLSVNPWVLGGATATMGVLVFLVMFQLVRTQRSPTRSGPEGFIGQTAVVRRELAPRGRVWFEGQPWFAELRQPGSVPEGAKVRIVAVEGLTLIVEPLEETPAGQSPQL